jgi:hypothetical protein
MMGSAHDTKEDRSSPPAEPCVELPLLMPTWQWAALEWAADKEELTVGQMLRRLVAAYLAKQGDA